MKSPTALPGPGIAAFFGKIGTWANVGLTPIGSTARLALLAASAPFACLGRLETRYTAVGMAGSFG